MFTGIIEETGLVKGFTQSSSGGTIKIECSKVLDDTKIGDSIAINGCCQTVVEKDSNSFTARVSQETLYVTNFKNLKTGDKVNLERALTPLTRMGGHIVSGHVDCTGVFVNKAQLADFYELSFEVPKEFCKYIVRKGSITINGISLTVAEIKDRIFKIAIIPHTFENTNLKDLKIGSIVNIETDIIGKYVEKFLSTRDNKNSIDENFLIENGFM